MENLVDLVKQMSISGDLNMDVLGSQADVSNPFDTGVRSNQLDDQDENAKVENIRRSRSENAISQGCDEAYVEKRKHKPTPRWLQYQSDQLQERRTMLNRRIIRKSSAVDSLLYSSRNVEAVREQMLNIFSAVDLFSTFLTTGNTNETFQQSGKQESFRHILKSSASIYESYSGSLLFRTTTGIPSGPDTFDKLTFIITFLIILRVTEILCRFRLILEGKTHKEIPESFGLEILEKFTHLSKVI